MARLFKTTTPVATGGRLFGGGQETRPDLSTTAGLQQLAGQAGLTTGLPKGEDPKKIFSGGLISDIFDTLNVFQYGVVGLLKGKGFSEGVRTRQSFTDKDSLGDRGIPGLIAGTALDILVDPMTYISPFSILKKIPGVEAGVDVAKTAFSKTRLGSSLGRSFIYRFGQDPVYKELAERSIKNVAVGNRNLLDLAKPLAELSPEAQKAISMARKAGKLSGLPADLLAKAKPAFDELDKLGKQAVEVGLLDAKTYEKNVGSYMARLYRKWEEPAGAIKKVIFPIKPKRIDISRFMKRTDIPEAVRTAMGEVLEAGYPTAKGLVQLNKAVENAKFFKEVASKWGSDVVGVGLKQLPETKRLGALSGKAVPLAIFDDIEEIIRIKKPSEAALNKLIGSWKFGKVVLNPATHGRNIISNFILNSWEGLSPHRIDVYAEAGKELATKGKLYKEAVEQGLGLNTFAAQEIRQMLTGVDNASMLKRLGNKGKQAMNKIADLYQKEEEFAKMAQYIFQKKQGKTAQQAWEIAERATFNYAQVTPFIRRMRESVFGFPFLTFTAKATPQAIKTALKHPTRISNIGKIKTAIENQADLKELQRERASEPEWVRNGFYVKLPMKDKLGRSAYFDLTYILPFGDLITGDIARRTPTFINLAKELGKNKDFFGNKIWRESDSTAKKSADLMRHLIKFAAPTPIAQQIPGGIKPSGERRGGAISRVLEKEKLGIEGGGAQTRTGMQELLRNVGLKIQPVDIEQQEWWYDFEKRKALEALLQESGIINQFNINYIPKEKETEKTGGRVFGK